MGGIISEFQIEVPFLIRNEGYWERSIVGELDGFGRALGDAGPALNTFFWVDRIRFILFHLIDLAGANLNTVPTTRTFFLIDNRMHVQNFKLQIAAFRWKTPSAMPFVLCY